MASTDEIKKKIYDEYMSPDSPFAAWMIEKQKPSPSGRSLPNPYPFAYYHDHESINGLWCDLIKIACDTNNYNIIVAELSWLRSNCPELGRDYYFSHNILYNSRLSNKHINMCSRAFVIGFIQGVFNCDVVADRDNGDLMSITEDLQSMTDEEYVCASVMIIPPLRYLHLKNSGSYTHIDKIEKSPWMSIATRMHSAGEMEANAIALILMGCLLDDSNLRH